MGILFFGKMGLERPLRKHASGMFLGRGRVHEGTTAGGTPVGNPSFHSIESIMMRIRHPPFPFSL